MTCLCKTNSQLLTYVSLVKHGLKEIISVSALTWPCASWVRDGLKANKRTSASPRPRVTRHILRLALLTVSRWLGVKLG